MKPNDIPADKTQIALINNNIQYIQKDIAEIKQSVRDLGGVYATQASVRENTERIDRLERKSNLWNWLSPTLAAVMGSILTFLIIEYLTRK